MKDLFDERERRLILQLPLSGRARGDSWTWSFEAKGSYTMRSGYKRLKPSPMRIEPHIGEVKWRAIWNLHIPAKAKNLLPIKKALAVRRVVLDDWC